MAWAVECYEVFSTRRRSTQKPAVPNVTLGGISGLDNYTQIIAL